MFYVIEIQTTNTGAVLPFYFERLDTAYSKYYQLLSVAATSDVPKHGAMLFNADGFVIESKVFDHQFED